MRLADFLVQIFLIVPCMLLAIFSEWGWSLILLFFTGIWQLISAFANIISIANTEERPYFLHLKIYWFVILFIFLGICIFEMKDSNTGIYKFLLGLSGAVAFYYLWICWKLAILETEQENKEKSH
jgi:hypothetical protein